MSNVIVSFARTPIGSFLGSLSSISSSNLGAVSIKGVISKVNLDPELVNHVIMGNVLSAGSGQAPARQASIYAGLSNSVNCLTINKMCGSGLESIILADQLIKNNPDQIIVAGGMENMSAAPYVARSARWGERMGHSELVDTMLMDGLWDCFYDCHMGMTAENLARQYNIDRQEQDPKVGLLNNIHPHRHHPYHHYYNLQNLLHSHHIPHTHLEQANRNHSHCLE